MTYLIIINFFLERFFNKKINKYVMTFYKNHSYCKKPFTYSQNEYLMERMSAGKNVIM